MLTLIHTNSDNQDFQQLVQQLDADLAMRDGAEHTFYAQFNKIAMIQHAIVVYNYDEPVGCGAIKAFSANAMEVKRMYVSINHRNKGIASIILHALERWAKELNYTACVLETGKKQPEAIALYLKNNYQIIPNYGQYIGVKNSVCFEKQL